MASYYSSWVADDDWRIRLDVTETTGRTGYTYTAKLYFQSVYVTARNTAVSWSITIDGTKTTGTNSSPGITTNSTVQIASASKTVARGTSAKTVNFAFTASFPSSSYSSYRTGASGTGSTTLPALASYTVSYNANGGSGAPSNQTKYYGKALTLSSVTPTRTGYSFTTWNTSSAGGGTSYAPGASYTSNAALSLYAIWKADTYTVTFDANGGTGAPAAQTKTYGVDLTLSSTVPTRTNYNFKGWGTSASSTTAQYAAGGKYTTNSAITLYAVWELAYTAPRITNLTVDRCNSSGTYSEEGTYAKVTFDWATDKSIAVGAAVVTVNNTNYTVSGTSGTSGSASQVVGGGNLSTENSYVVTIKVTDSGGSTTITSTLPPLAYIIDFSPAGGVSIGAPASETQLFDVHIPSNFMDSMTAQGISSASISNTGSLTNGGDITNTGDITNGGNITNTGTITTNHVYLRNDQALAGALTSGSYSSILRMNTSNQVELNWTTGGLKGRVRKQIWTGSWSSGSITVSEAPYYNIFMICVANAARTVIVAYRYPNGTGIRGTNAYPYLSSSSTRAFGFYGFNANASDTTLTLVKCHHWTEYEGTANPMYGTDDTITSIWGIL